MQQLLPSVRFTLGASASAAFFFGTSVLIPILLILIYLEGKQGRFSIALAAFVSYFFLSFTLVPLKREESEGFAYLKFEAIKEGRRGLSGKGLVRELRGEDGELLAKNIRFSLPLKASQFPKEEQRIRVLAKRISPYQVRLKIREPLRTDDRSLFKGRFLLKKRINQWIERSCPTKRSSAFIGGLLTGESLSDELTLELNRFGLQHILAISGFHFALLAFILSSLFRLLLKEKRALLLLLFTLSLYTLFLGFSPSVFRAYIMAMLFFSGQLMGIKTLSINTLSIAFLAIFLLDPLSLTGIGFQFSFLITASLLLLTPLISLDSLLPKRSFKELSQLSYGEKFGALVLNFLKGGLTISIAVSLISLPLTLFHFGSFPIQSLLYNLFFPAAVSLLFPLILLSCLLFFTPLITLSGWLVELLLKTAYGFPKAFEMALTLPPIPPWIAALLIAPILLVPLLKPPKREPLFAYL